MERSASSGSMQAGAKNILCVINVPGNPYLQAICKGLTERSKELGVMSSNLELPTADSTDQAKVSRDVGAYLQSQKGIDGVFTENAAVGTAATAAVDAAGLTGTVHVGTMEISRIALEQIKNGKIEFLMNEQPYLDGYSGWCSQPSTPSSDLRQSGRSRPAPVSSTRPTSTRSSRSSTPIPM
jgi:simple sugar transport system substrate-binding protein